MIVRNLLCVVLFVGLSASAHGQWYVDVDNTSGTEDGTSWSTAFTAIQPAIDAAFAEVAVNTAELSGDVWVAEGVYDEARTSFISDDGVNTGSIVMRSGVDIFGGFTGSETLRSQRDWESHGTVLDGSRARSGQAAYHVVVGANGATIDGFTIRGGNSRHVFRDEVRTDGGGMYNSTASPAISNCIFTENTGTSGGGIHNRLGASPVLTNCTFFRNEARIDGGGIYNEGEGSPTLINCTFNENLASSGGGIFNADSSTVLINCTFSKNTAMAYAGGMHNKRSSPTLINCSFISNASETGGGLYNEESFPSLTNCLIAENVSLFSGGGMFNIESSPVMINCTVAHNTTEEELGGIGNVDSSPTLINCIVWGNGQDWAESRPGTPVVTFSNIGTGYAGGGEGNFSADPRFVDVMAGDFRLRIDSPSIDAGTEFNAPAADINGVSRPQYFGIDMGAYEFIEPSDVDGTLAIDAVDVQLTINAVLGLPVPPGVVTDVDGGGDTDAVDVQLVINAALGL